ncbi:hypothetical protein DICPUDRAFT_146457 [Dictyostelium purpureum]|uniref:Uncharacterized protein n=1 Tax=Dictyostelium purpureum TaxID=5786 RepID=F0Z609_DICPU|nr:uncharacterized protein DICPUDRAFT_146457 [Dictyostelium purpureum]EGC40517.1 hypothetical protein DICPUDRAFT_146457 [Dictyostelium purpureum]|eukprot:XP_003282853.1 hypothetical protein DICPUDRAFT_146457 [Dictyostelium purpureum]
MASLIILSASLFISLLLPISFKETILIIFFLMILFIHLSPYFHINNSGTSSSRLPRRTVPISPSINKKIN